MNLGKNNPSIVITFIFLLVVIGIFSCSVNPTEKKGNPCPPNIVSTAPYDSPIWHPNGNYIGFNYTPLDSVNYPFGRDCVGVQYFNYDSTGFWLINADGSNMHRVLPFKLQTPVWSPDGKWIAFVISAQIYKMPFTNDVFDTINVIQLTTNGQNYFPSWSPDSKWIAFDSNTDSQVGGYRIWKMNTNGDNKSLVVDGRMPFWSNDLSWIYYVGLHSEIFKVNLISDTTEVIQITHLNEINIYATYNKYPKLSPSFPNIAFSSNNNSGDAAQIWIIDLQRKKTKQLTNKGIIGGFSWSPDGSKIVYTQDNNKKWNYDNGVLWIIDINTSYEQQLTFN